MEQRKLMHEFENGNDGSNIVDSGIEFNPSMKTTLRMNEIEETKHPVNAERLLDFVTYIQEGLNDFQTVSRTPEYQKFETTMKRTSADSLAGIVNNFDLSTPVIEPLAALALYKELVRAEWIIESK